MARRNLAVKQGDVTRAVKGVVAAGVEVSRVEVDPAGRIVIIAQGEADTPETAFDKWEASRARSS